MSKKIDLDKLPFPASLWFRKGLNRRMIKGSIPLYAASLFFGFVMYEVLSMPYGGFAHWVPESIGMAFFGAAFCLTSGRLLSLLPPFFGVANTEILIQGVGGFHGIFWTPILVFIPVYFVGYAFGEKIARKNQSSKPDSQNQEREAI